MTIAIYPASLDPITLGHMWVIRSALGAFDKVVVLVSNNPKKNYLFTQQERTELTEECFRRYKNISIVNLGNDFVVDYIRKNYHTTPVCIVKGLRNAEDFEYERKQAIINRKLATIPTFYVDSPPELEGISSSLIKEMMVYNNWENIVSYFVPVPVVQKLAEKCSLIPTAEEVVSKTTK